MICPCFDMTFIGFCVACRFPYIPSISEKQRYCFSESFGDCAMFTQHQAEHRSRTDERPLEVKGMYFD